MPSIVPYRAGAASPSFVPPSRLPGVGRTSVVLRSGLAATLAGLSRGLLEQVRVGQRAALDVIGPVHVPDGPAVAGVHVYLGARHGHRVADVTHVEDPLGIAVGHVDAT